MFVEFGVKFEGAEADVQRLNAAMAKSQRTAGVAADAQERMSKSTRRAGAASRAAAKDVKKLDDRMKQSRATVKSWIKTLIGIEVARRVIRGLLTTFLDFSKALNTVRAITNATDEQFARLTATAQELGRTTQFTATDAANALAFLTRTGLDVNQAIAVLPGTLSLAAATAVDLATASDIATNVMKGFGLQVEDMTEIVDTLAKTTTSSNVDIFNLSEALAVVAPIARSAGQSLAETAAMIGILGDNAIRGSAAGVALRRGLINLRTGAGVAGTAIARLGLQIEDADGNFVGLAEVFRQFNEIDLTPTERATALFELFGARGLAAAEVLANQGVGAIDAFAASIEDAAGTAERMQTQQMAGLVGSAKELTSATQGLAISWGEALAPALTVVADLIKDFILPTFRGILFVFEAMGPAMSLAIDTIVAGLGLLVTKAGEAFGLLTVGLGHMVQQLGQVAARFFPESLLGQAGDRMADFGARMQRQGVGMITTAETATEGLLGTITTSFAASSEVMGELIDKFNGVTAAADEAADAVEALKDETNNLVTTVQASLPDIDVAAFQEQLEGVREQLRGALQLEAEFVFQGAEAALEVQRRIGELTESQRDRVLELVAVHENLFGVLSEVAAAQDALAKAGEGTEEAAEAAARLVELMGELGQASRDADAALRDVGKTGESELGKVAGEADGAIRALSRMAKALGVLDNDLSKVLRSAIQVVKALGEVAKVQGAGAGKGGTSFFGTITGGAAGAAAGIGVLAASIGALAGVISLLGGGNRDQIQRENTEAIKQLTDGIGAMSDLLRETSGTQFGEFQRALDILTNAQFKALGSFFVITGITQEQFLLLGEVAELLGVQFGGTKEQAEQLIEALEALDFEALTEDFASAMAVLQQRFAIFDVEDPIDQLDAILAVFDQFTDIPLPAFDLSTAQGRAALDAFIRDLFDQITSGAFDFAALGGLTTQQALDLLAQIERTLDTIEQDAAEGVEAGEGTTSAFVRSSRITEVQGSHLVAVADTQLVRLTQIRDLLESGVPFRPPITPPPQEEELGGGNGARDGKILLNGDLVVPVTVQVAGPVENAAELAAELSDTVLTKIDQGLEELRIQKRRALGR